MDSLFYVYILQSLKDNSFYIGSSQDIHIRLDKHNNSKTGYTSTKKPWKIVYFETFITKSEALIREKFIKSQKSKKYIIDLIGSSAA